MYFPNIIGGQISFLTHTKRRKKSYYKDKEDAISGPHYEVKDISPSTIDCKRKNCW